MHKVILIISMMIIQGCTIGYLTTDDNLPASDSSVENCNLTYSLEVLPKEPERISSENLAEWNKRKQKLYSESADRIFGKGNCLFQRVTNLDQANFNIEIIISLNNEALAQEYLTGLSFGLIPSWGARHDYYSYKFEYDGNVHSYSIDAVSFNHLIVFPIFWVSFFTFNEANIFEKSLDNYLESL